MVLLAAAAFAMPAMAIEPGYEQWQVKVQTADLDLSSAEGQRALDKRLAQALTRLCGQPTTFTREDLAALEACRAEAMQSAAPQIDAARTLRAVAVASNR
ncbi:UrcA family protein [Sandarakinorhabdus sp. AAP62]|uniref:UrcA family protein n=1 Tax=Sandarakinorhabdus sp. AAP62 TaxID=1248916 RepID=UPI002434E763|nr:UrcA family protein [Sandarakinorhabdus sp. AAP62]